MDNPEPLFDPWTHTPAGEARGYINPHALDELWFHTGTACNLACPFCLEGSKPGDNRLNRVTLQDVQPFMDEALSLGVKQFSFTGGEPFIVKDFVNILRYASNRRPCLVLTNGTEPVLKRLHQIETLRGLMSGGNAGSIEEVVCLRVEPQAGAATLSLSSGSNGHDNVRGVLGILVTLANSR